MMIIAKNCCLISSCKIVLTNPAAAKKAARLTIKRDGYAAVVRHSRCQKKCAILRWWFSNALCTKFTCLSA